MYKSFTMAPPTDIQPSSRMPSVESTSSCTVPSASSEISSSTYTSLSSPALSDTSLPSLESVSDSSDIGAESNFVEVEQVHASIITLLCTPSRLILISHHDATLIAEVIWSADSQIWSASRRNLQGHHNVEGVIHCPDTRLRSVFQECVQDAQRRTQASALVFDGGFDSAFTGSSFAESFIEFSRNSSSIGYSGVADPSHSSPSSSGGTGEVRDGEVQRSL